MTMTMHGVSVSTLTSAVFTPASGNLVTTNVAVREVRCTANRALSMLVRLHLPLQLSPHSRRTTAPNPSPSACVPSKGASCVAHLNIADNTKSATHGVLVNCLAIGLLRCIWGVGASAKTVATKESEASTPPPPMAASPNGVGGVDVRAKLGAAATSGTPTPPILIGRMRPSAVASKVRVVAESE